MSSREVLVVLCILVIAPTKVCGKPNTHLLQALVVEREPWAYRKEVNHRYEWVGYMISLSMLIEQYLGLELNYTAWPSTQGYNAAVEMIQNGPYDILIGDISVTYKRSQFVQFTTYIFLGSYSIATVMPKKGADRIFINVFGWLSPFSWTAWVLILASTCVLSLSLWLYGTKFKRTKRLHAVKPGEALWFGFFLSMGPPISLQQGRWMTIVAKGVFLVLLSLYTAELTARVTADAFDNKIVNKLEQLQDRTIGVLENSHSLDVAREWGIKNIQGFSSYEHGLDSVLKGAIDGYIGDTIGLDSLTTLPPYCAVKVTDAAKLHSWAFALKKNSTWVDPINQLLLRFRDNGVSDKLRAAYLDIGSASSHCNKDVKHEVSGLGVAEIGAILFIFPLLLMVALLRIIWRYFYFKARVTYTKKAHDPASPHTVKDDVEEEAPDVQVEILQLINQHEEMLNELNYLHNNLKNAFAITTGDNRSFILHHPTDSTEPSEHQRTQHHPKDLPKVVLNKLLSFKNTEEEEAAMLGPAAATHKHRASMRTPRPATPVEPSLCVVEGRKPSVVGSQDGDGQSPTTENSE